MKNTKISWCDSTVNPVPGCKGCELYPGNANVIIESIRDHMADAGIVATTQQIREIIEIEIKSAYDRIPPALRHPSHSAKLSTTNLWHVRENVLWGIFESFGPTAAEAARVAIRQAVTCYAAILHLNRGTSITKPERKLNPGYAPVFEQPKKFPGRMAEAAKWQILTGQDRADGPWKKGLPRMIFISDMGDALSSSIDFEYLANEILPAVRSPNGRHHIWQWLTKRPNRMAEFARKVGGLPENMIAMTTMTSAGEEQFRRVDQLRQVAAKMRGLSIEPLREAIPPEKLDLSGIDWVIVGGESGAPVGTVHPFDVAWAEALLEHCRKNGVAFFLKQIGRHPVRGKCTIRLGDGHGGDWDEWPRDVPRVREFPAAFRAIR